MLRNPKTNEELTLVRVFCAQQTEQLLKRMGLKHWKELAKDELNQSHHDLFENWKTCAIGEMIKIDPLETIWRDER